MPEQFSAFWMVSRQSFVSSCPKEQRGKEECHLRCVCVFLPSALCLSAGCAPAGRCRGSGLFDAGCWCIPELCLWACQGAHCSAPYPLLWLNSPPRLVFCVWHRLKSGLEACAVPSHPEPTPAQLLEPLTDVFAQPRFINRR